MEIINNNEKKIVKLIDSDNGEINYYRWVPDRNIVIYSFKSSGAKNGTVQIDTYDVDTDLERSYPEIGELPKGSEVNDIELSALTNIVYVKIKAENANAIIYKFNIMNNLNYVMDTSINTVIKETYYSDNLLYQDKKNRIYIRDGIKGGSKLLSFKGKMVLLGIDGEDKAYIGELNNDNKVYKLYYGKAGQSLAKTCDIIGFEKSCITGRYIHNEGWGNISVIKRAKKYL